MIVIGALRAHAEEWDRFEEAFNDKLRRLGEALIGLVPEPLRDALLETFLGGSMVNWLRRVIDASHTVNGYHRETIYDGIGFTSMGEAAELLPQLQAAWQGNINVDIVPLEDRIVLKFYLPSH